MKKLNLLLNLILPLLGVLALFLVWGVSATILDDPIVLPKISATVKSLFKKLGSANFYTAFGGTLLRVLIAFLGSFIVATVLSILTTTSSKIKKAIMPLIAIIRAFPTIAMVLWVVLWTNSSVAPMLVTAVVVLPTLYTSVSQALADIDGELLTMCKTYGVSKVDTLKKVILPPLLPKLAEIAGSGFSLNLKLMVAAEIIAQTGKSLGILMQIEKVNFETAGLLALVIVTVVTGLVIEYLVKFLARRFRKWKA